MGIRFIDNSRDEKKREKWLTDSSKMAAKILDSLTLSEIKPEQID